MSNSTSWLTVTGGASGSGSGTVAFSAAANSSTSSRTGTLTIAGQSFSVTQPGINCTYAISPTSGSVAGGWRHRLDGRDVAGRVCVDGREQQHVLADSHGWRERQRQRHGRVQRGGQQQHQFAHGHADDCRTELQRDAAGHQLHVCAFADERLGRRRIGGTGSTGVTSPAGCAWTGVSNNTSWLTVTGGASGSGSGTVAFSAAANSSINPRTGTLTIAGQSFSVTQPGLTCTYSIVPASGSVPAAWWHRLDGCDVAGRVCVDGREQQHVLADGHGWRERQRQRHGGVQRGGQQQHQPAHGHADDRWTEFQRDAAGHGVHVCAFVDERVGPGESAAQFDRRDVACRMCVDRREQQHVLADGHGWRERQRQRHGGVHRRCQQQPSSRTGTLTIAGQRFSVTQPGITCTFTFSATSGSVPAWRHRLDGRDVAGRVCVDGREQQHVLAGVTSGGSGTGNGSVTFTAAANTTAQARTGTLDVAGQPFTVTQAGAACDVTLAPTSRTVAAAGGASSTSVNATTGCAWTATSNTGWLTVTGGASGNGNGTVSFSAAANTSAQGRAGSLTIGGDTLTVNQDGAPCSFTVSPTAPSMSVAGGSLAITVTAGAGCSWTSSSTAAWVVATNSGGSGSGSAEFTVAANMTSSARSAALSIAGRIITVTQAANTCSYTLSPGSSSIGGEGGTGTITVSTGSGCPWAVTNMPAWISVSGTGPSSGSVTYTVQPNTTGINRLALLLIGPQAFVVSQGVTSTTPPPPPDGGSYSLHGLAHGTVDVDSGQQPAHNRDGRRGLLLDILQYSRHLGRGDHQRRFRIRNRGIHGCREYDLVRTLSRPEHCRTHHHRHAGGKHL